MRSARHHRFLGTALFFARTLTPLALAAMAGSALAQAPVTTEFSYQGELRSGSNPTSATTADFKFRLYDSFSNGALIGSEITRSAVPLSNGRFTVSLDFGAQFAGQSRYLEIETRAPAGSGSFTLLTPRQPLTAAPYALYALSGNPGPTGPQGIQGPQGATGSQGSSGAPGATGPQGTPGAQGSTGPQGVPGSTGPQGTPGATGASPWQLIGSATFYNAGFVGIGTSAPSSPLHVLSSTANAVRLQGPGNYSTGARVNFQDDFYNMSIDNYADGRLSINTGQGLALMGGNVGVGTTSPSSRFAVAGNADIAGDLAVDSAGTSTGTINGPALRFGGAGGFGSGEGIVGKRTAGGNQYGLDFFTASALRFSITNSGRIGIGGVFPLTTLDIYDPNQALCRLTSGNASNGAVLELSNGQPGPNNLLGAINFSNSTGAVPGQISYHPGSGSDDRIAFRVNNSTQMTLYGNGLTQVKTLQILGGSDLAEPFDVAAAAQTEPEPGHVVVIDPKNPGGLILCDHDYDAKVAGVISGANGLNAGLILKAEGNSMADGDHPVALTGRVWCFVDASFGAVSPGDRLTTSTTPGHARRANDATRAPGAVIGKAMTELHEGRGLVLVLVNLQ